MYTEFGGENSWKTIICKTKKEKGW